MRIAIPIKKHIIYIYTTPDLFIYIYTWISTDFKTNKIHLFPSFHFFFFSEKRKSTKKSGKANPKFKSKVLPNSAVPQRSKAPYVLLHCWVLSWRWCWPWCWARHPWIFRTTWRMSAKPSRGFEIRSSVIPRRAPRIWKPGHRWGTHAFFC